MNITELIGPERVVLDLRVRDKLMLMNELASRAALPSALDEAAILRALQAREELGSTGIGRGFALPHARVGGLAQFFGLFARLGRPIEFEAIDGAPVDLVFLLLIPPDAGQEHVGALAAISRRLRQAEIGAQLRRAKSAREVYDTLTAA